MSIKFGGLTLSTPYLPASGCWGYGIENRDLFKEENSAWGAITTKTISINPRNGHPSPRIFETEGGIVNRVGLQNCGLDIFLTEKLPKLKKLPMPAVVSIFGENYEEWITLARNISKKGASALELNLSCPNLKGEVLARNPEKCARVVEEVKKSCSIPVWVKINAVDSPVKLSIIFEKLGADALICSNTIPGAATLNGEIYEGGLSGPAIKPIVLRAIKQINHNSRIDIGACGGICTAGDVKEYRLAGAKAFIIGSALFKNPDTAIKILKEEKKKEVLI